MPYYCKNCLKLLEYNACPTCGDKNLPVVTDTDYCFLIEIDSLWCGVLTGALDEEGIVYSIIPTSKAALTIYLKMLEKYSIYVQYQHLERAEEITKNMFFQRDEKVRQALLDNVSRLNISEKVERKLRRKLKLTQLDNVLEYCVELVKTADRITRNGIIWNSPEAAEFLFAQKGNLTLSINSETFEILAVDGRV
jgi:hypothetical protein